MSVWNDKVFSSAPLDKTAGTVVSKGIHWTPSEIHLPHGYVRKETPLPTKRFTGPQDQSLIGKRFGKLVVKGPAAEMKANNMGVAWVVRCDCGAYEHRRTRSLKRTEHSRLHCSHCDYLHELKAGNKQPSKSWTDGLEANKAKGLEQ